jgi:gamma-glutamyltranspeptidase
MACPRYLGCNEDIDRQAARAAEANNNEQAAGPPANATSQGITGHPMRDQFSNTQSIRKPAVTSKGGIVAAQSGKAAQVGAEVLAAGGDCVDAVIATTFALGVLEPWMSGLGGGGAMVLYRAREDRYEVIDYGMRAPLSLRPEVFR